MNVNDVTKIEQAIARGATNYWLMHAYGLTYQQLAAILDRMDDGNRIGTRRRPEPPPPAPVDYDEVAVLEIMAGARPVTGPGGTRNPDRDEALRRLAGQGYTDKWIGARIGMTQNAVARQRARKGIPAGSVRTGGTDDQPWLAMIRSSAKRRYEQRKRSVA